MEKFIIITWPESQKIMDIVGFEEHCYPILDEIGEAKYGDCAYFAEESWLKKHFDTKEQASFLMD